MRAVLIWAIAICLIGTALITATDPFKERGADLSGALLSVDQLPGSWSTSRLSPGRAEQLLTAPCSGQPLPGPNTRLGFGGRHFAQEPAFGPFIEHIVVATDSPATAAAVLDMIRSEASTGCTAVTGSPPQAITDFPSIGLGTRDNSAIAVQRQYSDSALGSVDEVTVFDRAGANVIVVRQTATRGAAADPGLAMDVTRAATRKAQAPEAERPSIDAAAVAARLTQAASLTEQVADYRSEITRGATFAGIGAAIFAVGMFVASRLREIRRLRAIQRAARPAAKQAKIPRKRVPAPIVEHSTLDIGQKLLHIKEMNRRDRDQDTASMRAVQLQQQMLKEAGIIDRLNAESGSVYHS